MRQDIVDFIEECLDKIGGEALSVESDYSQMNDPARRMNHILGNVIKIRLLLLA